MSPLVFQKYLQDIQKEYGSKVTSVWMRNKGTGWRKASTVLEFENGQRYQRIRDKNDYGLLYVNGNPGVRASCFTCPFKGDQSVADITLGDFWGMQGSELDDDKGLSVVICRTEKGKALAAAASDRCDILEKTMADAMQKNPALLYPVSQRSAAEDAFFQQLHKGGFRAARKNTHIEGLTRHIILFGCGKIARQFYFRHWGRIHIDYALSNNPSEHVFSPEDGVDYEVRRPEAKRGKGPLIVLCAADYVEMADQLILLGYTPFEDFIDYQTAALVLTEKKAALFYGICHLRGISNSLRGSVAFMSRYEPFYFADYLPQSSYQQMRLHWLTERCEIFLYGSAVTPQRMQKIAALRRLAKKATVHLCVPAAFFGGYFPQKKRAYNTLNRYAIKSKGHDYTPFSYGDSWINQCIDRGMTVDDVLESLRGGAAYDRDFVLRYLEKEWQYLDLQERQSDFKIVDYLKKNFQKRRLFRNEAHMENEVLEYYAGQVLEQLGLPAVLPHVTEPLMMCSQHLIYPGVAEVLGVEWDVEREPLQLYTYAGWKTVTPREYVARYMDTCKKIKELKEANMLP